MGSCPWIHMTFWSRGLVRSRDKLKPLYLHYHSTYGHQTWQDGNLPWWAPAYKVTWFFDHVVFWDIVTNWKPYISTTAMPMMAGWWLTLSDFYIKSHDHIITWSCKISWQTKIIIYPLTQCLWLSILAGWGCTMRSSLP